MTLRAVADKNMGQFVMTRAQARDVIERARKGLPVTPFDLQRACMIAYKGKEPRKLVLPILTRAQRCELNATLIHNLWSHRYHQQENQHAALSNQDESEAVRKADATSS